LRSLIGVAIDVHGAWQARAGVSRTAARGPDGKGAPDT
jgi:hypothetical protein